MGFFDEIKKLTRPYDDDGDEFLDEDEAYAEPAPRQQTERRPNPFAGFGGEAPVPPPASSYNAPSARAASAPPASRHDGGKVVNFSSGIGAQMQVVIESPVKFEQAASIADHLRERHSIVINLESTPKDVSRRLVDFLSGVVYALEGNIKKIAANTYIITPQNVNLSGGAGDELENSGVYF